MSETAENRRDAVGVTREVAAQGAADPRASNQPRPIQPPPPTVWPFVTAVGMTIMFWGVVLDLLVVSVGAGVFVIGMAGLVGDWVREHRNQTT
jgi:hypothetical protein